MLNYISYENNHQISMARKAKVKTLKCKKCGFSFEVNSQEDKDRRQKEWPFVAPMPDKDGNVTITQMATWKCDCGYTIRGSAGKTKGKFEGKSRKEQIADLLEKNEKFEIEIEANGMGAEKENLEKMLNFMIKKGMASGKIEDGFFIPN